MSPALAGCRILVPRTSGSDSAVVEVLRAAGAAAEAVSLLTIEPPTDTAAFDTAVRALAAGTYSWVGFASARGVAAVVDRAGVLGVPSVPTGTRVAAVGAATAAALRVAGLPVDLLPSRGGSAADLAAAWPDPVGADRVLLPASEIGLPLLLDALRDKGYRVDRVAAYTPAPIPVPAAVTADLRSGRYTAVVLTAPSLAAAVAATAPDPRVLVVAIGATTAAAAADLGLSVAAVADRPSPAGLLAALRRALTAGDPAPPITSVHPADPAGPAQERAAHE